jgi:ATP adenylyltransferase
MEQLWAPWRLAYVAVDKPASGEPPCFICRGLAQTEDRQNLIAWRTPRSVVVLNRFPYNNGHLLVAPHGHKARLDELSPEEHLDLMLTVQKMVGVLDGVLKPQGYNIGLNLGLVAGAGLPGHLHWHIVPRWAGDTNFMPVLTDTRVIVQSLATLYDLLVEQLRSEMMRTGEPSPGTKT